MNAIFYSDCPEEDTLRLFWLDELDQDEDRHIFEHVLGCERCLAMMQAFEFERQAFLKKYPPSTIEEYVLAEVARRLGLN